MTDKKVAPEEASAALLWLECKQICRGYKSEFFPNITQEEAVKIRTMGFDKFMEWMKEEDDKQLQ